MNNKFQNVVLVIVLAIVLYLGVTLPRVEGEMELEALGVTNLDSLTLDSNLVVGGTSAVTGASTFTTVDINGTADGLILDADGDTTIASDTDDQIDIEISGADDFQLTANTFTVLAGSKINPQNATNSGAVFALYGVVVFGDVTVVMGVIPANANIIDVTWEVGTAFDDSGTDLVDCGINGGDTDAYVDNLDVSSATLNRMGDGGDMPEATSLGDVGGTDVQVDCTYTGQNTNAAAGAAILVIQYMID